MFQSRLIQKQTQKFEKEQIISLYATWIGLSQTSKFGHQVVLYKFSINSRYLVSESTKHKQDLKFHATHIFG